MKPEWGVTHIKMQEQMLPHRGSKAQIYWAYSSSSKEANMAGEQWGRERKEENAVGESGRGKEFEFYFNARIQYHSNIILVLGIQAALPRPQDDTKYSLQHHQKMIASECSSYNHSVIIYYALSKCQTLFYE